MNKLNMLHNLNKKITFDLNNNDDALLISILHNAIKENLNISQNKINNEMYKIEEKDNSAYLDELFHHQERIILAQSKLEHKLTPQ